MLVKILRINLSEEDEVIEGTLRYWLNLEYQIAGVCVDPTQGVLVYTLTYLAR
jgi:hypothetical protein